MAQADKLYLQESACVHVWSAGLDVDDAQFAALSALLDADELARARRFHFERDRRHFTVARGVLRDLIGRYLNVAADTGVKFGYGTRGKPFLAEPGGGLRFNVSHSYGRALFAFAWEREIGVDLEGGVRLGDDWPGLVRRIFSAREQAELNALPPERRRAAFLNGWTRKEAFLKATGLGIVDGLQTIEVTLGPGRPPTLLAAATEDAARWQIYDLRSDGNFAAALVAADGPVTVRRYEYTVAAK